jgi:hypothetical protein
VSSPARLLAAAALACASFIWASPARADVSSWMSAAAGPINWRQGEADYQIDPALQLDIGVGTTPENRFIAGGLFRLTTLFGSGTDLGLLLRGTTRGFQEGGFGLALDAGGYARFWDDTSYGFLGSLMVGAPLGLSLTLQGALGTKNAVAFGGFVGIDFLRLTVYRKTMTDLWPNPYLSPQTARAGSPRRSF